LVRSPGGASSGEHHRVAGEGLDLQRIAARIGKEHGGLLAWLATEPHGRFDQETKSLSAQFSCNFLPFWKGKNHAKMTHGNRFSIDQIIRLVCRRGGA